MIKNLVYTITLTFALAACGGSGGKTPPTPKPNTAPTTPSLVSPVNNSLCINNTQTFSWKAATDAEGDAISYELQLASNNTFTNNASIISTTNTSKSITLNKGKAYYWRVRAKDSKKKTGNYSSVFQFYTEGEEQSNILPFLPQLESPTLNTVVQTKEVTLRWKASDADGDVLTYTVYFGETNPPTNSIATNISEKQYNKTLASLKTYYWYVVVKDSKGGETKGQVWYFKTD